MFMHSCWSIFNFYVVCFCLKFKEIHSLFERTLEKKIEKKKEASSAQQEASSAQQEAISAPHPRSAQLPKPQPSLPPGRNLEPTAQPRALPFPSLFSLTAGALTSASSPLLLPRFEPSRTQTGKTTKSRSSWNPL
jgi:hypothetical protein